MDWTIIILALIIAGVPLYYFVRRQINPEFDVVLFKFPSRHTTAGKMYIMGLSILLAILLYLQFSGAYETRQGTTMLVIVAVLLILTTVALHYSFHKNNKKR